MDGIADRERLTRLEERVQSLAWQIGELQAADKAAQDKLADALAETNAQIARLASLANQGKGALAVLLSAAAVFSGVAAWLADRIFEVLSR